MNFLKAVEEQFVHSDKAMASTLMKRLLHTSYKYSKGVREHIMQIRDTATQLKTLKVEISNSFLVYFIFNSLPKKFITFKVS